MRRDTDDEDLDEDEDVDDEELDEATEATETSSGRLGGFAAGLTIGVLVGAGVALLFAPASGNVTRRRLRRNRMIRDAAETSVNSTTTG